MSNLVHVHCTARPHGPIVHTMPRSPLPPALLPLVLVLLALLASPAMARDPILTIPVDCTLGEDCFILNYVDSDPGPGAADFTCGPRSYDGHKGTDVALMSFAAMEAGVAVRPAAPGVVTALRDGMPDTGLAETPPEVLEGRDCGNGLVIDHGNGWETQYCHLREGSLAVTQGQRVTLSTTLGQIGYSGRTAFPHLHLSVRQDGAVVDPFNTDQIVSCGEDDGPEDDLWGEVIAYDAGGLIGLGIETGVPDYTDLKAGGGRAAVLPANAPALVGWGLIAGGRAGDLVEIEIRFPDDQRLIQRTEALERTQAMLFRAAGKKRPATGWPMGDYSVSVRLIRDGTAIDEDQRQIRVGN